MSSVETFIVITALLCSLGGGIILLSSLAGRRAQLVRAFNIQQDMLSRENDENLPKAEGSEPDRDGGLDFTPPE